MAELVLSKDLEETLRRFLSLANERRHEYATLEHLLLALLDDPDAVPVFTGCGVQLDLLRGELTKFLDVDLAGLATDNFAEAKPTAGVGRVIQRAKIHVEKAGRTVVNGANVLVALFSERESHAVYYLQLQNMTRLDAVEFMMRNVVEGRNIPHVPPVHLVPPPKLPAQGAGPHAELNSEGIVGFAPPESLDRDGNHLSRLRGIHPDLRELARELAASLGRGNAPHAALSERVAAYASLIDKDLTLIDFRRLYSAGVRLANAAHAVNQAILDKELPPLEWPEQERLKSLLDLHGPFILATAAGAEAIADEDRYKRRPAEERELRNSIVNVAEALQGRPDLIEPDIAEQALAAAQQIGQGNNPERSIVAGRASVRNVMISIVSGAIGSALFVQASPIIVGGAAAATAWFMTLTVNETIKRLPWFQSLTKSMASNLDTALTAQSKDAAGRFRSGLRRQSQFVKVHKPALRRLAGTSTEFDFLRRALDWFEKLPEESSESRRNQ